MMKVLLLLAIWVSAPFALTLDDVRQNLRDGDVESDTVEAKIRSTLTNSAGTQVVDIYMVRKGPAKMLMEIKSPLLNQRSILSDNRLQVTDLSTQKSQVLPYKGNEMSWESMQAPNPLDTGNWDEPVALSDSLFMLNHQGTQVLYHSRLQKIVQITQVLEQGGQSLVSMSYDEQTKALKTLQTEVTVQGSVTQMKMEFLQVRSAKNFPDRFFEF